MKCVLALWLSLFIFLATGYGQTPSANYSPNVGQVGLPSNGVFSGGSIDTIQLNNGNLHIDIPLLHFSGIGMDTDIHFTYDSRVFGIALVPFGNGSQTWMQVIQNAQNSPLGLISDPLSGFVEMTSHQETWECGNPYPVSSGTATAIDSLNFRDSDRTSHLFPISGYTPATQNKAPCIPNNTYKTTAYSDDESGYFLTMDNSGNPLTMTDKHGRKYVFAGMGG